MGSLAQQVNGQGVPRKLRKERGEPGSCECAKTRQTGSLMTTTDDNITQQASSRSAQRALEAGMLQKTPLRMGADAVQKGNRAAQRLHGSATKDSTEPPSSSPGD